MANYPTATFRFKTLGREGTFEAPALAEDVERIVGQPGAVLEGYYNQYAFQDRNVKMRENVAKACEEFTGVARKQHTETSKRSGEEVTVYDESEQEYINSLTTGENPKLSAADYAAIWDAENEKLGDWETARTQATQRKPAKGFYDQANIALNAIKAGKATQEKFLGNLSTKLGQDFDTFYGEFNVDNIARALRDLADKEARERSQSLLA